MEKLENYPRYSRASQPQFFATRQRRSGYEPSDTETEWQESPWHDLNQWNGDLRLQKPNSVLDQPRNKSPIKVSRRGSARFEDELSSTIKASMASPPRRRHSRSPYKPHRVDGNIRGDVSPLSPKPTLDSRNVSPFSKTEGRRHVSPYKPVREDHDFVNAGTISLKRIENDKRGGYDKVNEISRVSEKSNYSRSQSAPRPRYCRPEEKGRTTPSPLPRNLKEREANHRNPPSVGELNEMVVDAKISKPPVNGALNYQSTDSFSQGDIFFSQEYAAMRMTMQKIIFPNKGGDDSRSSAKPQFSNGRNYVSHQRNKENGNPVYNSQRNASTTVMTRTSTGSGSAFSRQSSDKISTTSSKLSGTSRSTERFVANRRKGQTDAWFSCIKRGPCRTSKSPEKIKEFDEAAFIEKAFVAETLRQFWADKHQPASLDGFACHKQEAQLLKQLVSHDVFPHILLKGPCGSGKKTLTMALLREIFGDSSWDISHDLRYYHIQETRPMQVVVPVTSSAHHVELNVYSEPNVIYALMALVKEISSNFAVTPEISTSNFRTDYKVMVLYEVDKAAENIQHLIKWIMDCYTDSCKLIVCCEDDVDLLEPVKNRCKVVKVDAPVTHEIMEVLIQIARKEEFDLPMTFAAKIANKSRQNLRRAIMALEACKAHNYPFADDQPIPVGWEEVLHELAAEILADPSHNRIFSVRGKFQKLLVDFVHPNLILQRLVEHFLKAVEASSKRELYYWHAYYEKRLPMGTGALLKLEEFVAKFMSIHRKKSYNQQKYP